MSEHRSCHLALIFITLVVMLIMFAMNGLNTGGDIIPGLYVTGDMETLSDKYYIEITPAGTTFSIWGAIYFWQVLFIAYGLSTICRQGPEGYLYYSPGIMPSGIYWSYIINNILNISWLLLFDREQNIAALVVIAVMWVTLLIPLVISHKAVADNTEILRKNGMMKEVWLIRFLVQNAFAMYITWLTVATLLNFTIVLAYDAGVDQSTASTISLGILAGEILLWLLLDFAVLPKYTNYLFSPYIVLPIAIGGSLAKNFDPWQTNTIITVALLGLALLAFLVKIILMFVRHCRNKNEAPIESTLEKTQIPA